MTELEVWSKLFENEMTKWYYDLLSRNTENQETILGVLPMTYTLKIENAPKSSKVETNLSQCQARTFSNGVEGQCTRDIVCGNYCKRHNNKLMYGNISEEIPSEYIGKFTKRLKRAESQSSNDIKTIKLHKINIDIDNTYLPSYKNNLVTINYNDIKYYLDKLNNRVFTFDDNKPSYVGILVNNLIIRQ